MLHYRSFLKNAYLRTLSLVFYRRTASFRRQIDENSRSLSEPGLRPIPGPRPRMASLVEQKAKIRVNRACDRNLARHNEIPRA